MPASPERGSQPSPIGGTVSAGAPCDRAARAVPRFPGALEVNDRIRGSAAAPAGRARLISLTAATSGYESCGSARRLEKSEERLGDARELLLALELDRRRDARLLPEGHVLDILHSEAAADPRAGRYR